MKLPQSMRWAWPQALRPRLLDIYLISQTLIGIAIVAPIVLCMYLVILIATIPVQVNTGLGFVLQFFWDILLRLPALIDFNFPFIALLGTMLGLGRLAENGEINAMRFAGASVYRITAVIAILAALLASSMFVFKEYVVTPSATKVRLQEGGGSQHFFSQNYYWVRSENGLTGFAPTDRQIDHYRDLMILRFSSTGHLQRVIRAEEARYADKNPHEKAWHLSKAFVDDYVDDSAQSFDDMWLDELIDLDGGNWLGYQANELRWRNLNQFDCRRQRAGSSDIDLYCLEFWYRNANPLLLFTLMLFASSFIYGLNRIQPISLRMMGGLCVCAVFIGLGNVMPYISSSTKLPFSLLVMGPVILFLVVACMRIYRIGRLY